jgi:DNA repair exonuclease SbcCD ATPase subunit
MKIKNKFKNLISKNKQKQELDPKIQKKLQEIEKKIESIDKEIAKIKDKIKQSENKIKEHIEDTYQGIRGMKHLTDVERLNL